MQRIFSFNRIVGAAMALAICAAAAGCGPSDARAGSACTGVDDNARYDWPSYASIDDMTQHADEIVYATVVSCAKPKGSSPGYDTTITATVIRSVAGGAAADGAKKPSAGETIDVRGYTAPGSGAGRMTIGRSYVLFLNGDRYQLTPADSVFPVTGGTAQDPSTSRNPSGSMALSDSLAVKLGIADANDLQHGEPTGERDVARLERIRDEVGMDAGEDGYRPGTVSSGFWWSQASVDDAGDVAPPHSTMTVSLAPWAIGTYRLTGYCAGTGSFDMQLAVGDGGEPDESDIRHETLECLADGIGSASITIVTTSGKERSRIKFVPSAGTKAAAGFRAGKVG
ncbi:hypothetical protein [Bifidobacterium scardovii]|uniref:Lipoprotein n=1 Tax=Bifidobacterium scardovii TaxID=158787 RepID=A0A087DHY0_9BIFI|nr:hypothetical protein [Bifidobacterium scardovii]KFI95130.1 hypothetical protein BSCA_0948 [Bifidobacterium scardovii]MDK6348790.1 hypothetical protein [Bifidobacterium scardovii]MDU8982798.1 hypothetical protein [Bifidobacterium scardovii]BAQ31518.1 hypothetical protein BBSC_1438 [Bifidobacterium scardovii JCM 12489 = DSM 13734]